jgi:putative glutamine amidotransferase
MTTSLAPLDGALRLHAPVAYAEAVAAAGGAPMAIGPLAETEKARPFIEAIDGLLLIGGPDVDPQAWGEPKHPEAGVMLPRRQAWDLALVAAAEALGTPVLGVCLGCQEMAVSRSGTLIQHVYDEPSVGSHGGGRRPRASHMVVIEPDSALASLIGGEPLLVNSTHHQAVREPGRGMRVVARSEDGLVEAIEDAAGGRFFLGVQWHPEGLFSEPRHLAIFEGLVRAAAAFRARH